MMTSQGPRYPSNAASDSSAGSQPWVNLSSVFTEDSNSTSYDAAAGISEILKLTGFGFSIPAGSTIDGVVAEIKRNRGSSSANMHDQLVQLRVGGAFSGDNKATATRWPVTAAYATYGGAADVWGLSLSVGDINSSDFGVGVQGTIDTNSSDDGLIDTVRLTVYYTAPAGGVFSMSALEGLTCNGPKNFNRLR